MAEERRPEDAKATRREFLKTSTVAAAGTALAANLGMLANVHAAGSDTIKVGLIGCGGRGSGAADNVLQLRPQRPDRRHRRRLQYRIDGSEST